MFRARVLLAGNKACAVSPGHVEKPEAGGSGGSSGAAAAGLSELRCSPDSQARRFGETAEFRHLRTLPGVYRGVAGALQGASGY